MTAPPLAISAPPLAITYDPSYLAVLFYFMTMTNTTKKQTNALCYRSTLPGSSIETPTPTVKDLLDKNSELKRHLRKYKGVLYW